MSSPFVVDSSHHLARSGGASLVPFIPTPNMGGALRPTGIILHDTAGPSLRSATDWLRKAEAKASAHLVIDTDASVVQMVAFDRVAWHAGVSSYEGVSGCNARFLGIEMVNPGCLNADGMAWFKHVYPRSVHRATKEHGPGRWMPYPDEQVEAVIAACKALVAAYPSIKVITTHWAVSPGRKVDPNPLFPLDYVRAEVFAPKVPRFLTSVEEAPHPGPLPVSGEREKNSLVDMVTAPHTVSVAGAVTPAKETAVIKSDLINDETVSEKISNTSPEPGKIKAAAQKTKDAAGTVKNSMSLRLLLVGGAFKAVEYCTDWLDQVWNTVLWAVGVFPEITTEVRGLLTTSQEVAGWFKIPWGDVAVVLTGAAFMLFFVRHFQDKRKLEAQEKTGGC